LEWVATDTGGKHFALSLQRLLTRRARAARGAGYAKQALCARDG